MWWHNTYPGRACDVPSHLYSFSFEPKHDWSRPYATQPEIQAYIEHCVTKYDLDRACGSDTASRAPQWNDDDARRGSSRPTRASSTSSTSWSARSACSTTLDPAGSPASTSSPGTRFHSARWDHDHDLAGEPRRRSSAARRARCSSSPRSPRSWATSPSSSARPTGCCRRTTRRTRTNSSRLRADPTRCSAERQAIYDRLDRALTFSNKKINAFCTQQAGCEQPRTRRGSRGPGQAHAELSVRLQAPAALERVLPDVQPAQRRAGHRSHRPRDSATASKPPTA